MIAMRVPCFFILLLMLVLSGPNARFAAGAAQTFDQMTPQDLDSVSQVTLAYYLCVSDKLDSVTGADKSSPERIFTTYPPFIHILRQQCRISLLNVEKELYALGLNPEFITNYVTTLRDDVQHFALQQVLKKAESERAEARNRQDDDADPRKSKGNAMGFGIFTPRKQADGETGTAGNGNGATARERQ